MMMTPGGRGMLFGPAWWRHLSLLVRGWRNLWGWASRVLVVAADDVSLMPPAAVSVAWRRCGRLRPVGRFWLDQPGLRALRDMLAGGPAPGAVELHLPSSLLLHRTVSLPLACERQASRLIGPELDRVTPFRRHEIYWRWVIERRDPAHGRLHLRLTVVPRVTVLPLTAALAQVGAAPTLLFFAGTSGAPERILLPRPVAQPVPHRRRWREGAMLVGAGACAGLLIAALLAPRVLPRAEVQAALLVTSNTPNLWLTGTDSAR
jgi:hypothetical protein